MNLQGHHSALTEFLGMMHLSQTLMEQPPQQSQHGEGDANYCTNPAKRANLAVHAAHYTNNVPPLLEVNLNLPGRKIFCVKPTITESLPETLCAGSLPLASGTKKMRRTRIAPRTNQG
jgi:hypothetical protein